MTTTATRSLADLQEMLSRHDSELVSAGLPVHPRLTQAFPRGLRLGAVHTLSGSLAVAAGLLALPSQQGWCAAVGLPELSLEAVARWGGLLDQLVLVPSPGRSPWDAVGTLVDATDLIVTRSAPIAPAQARRLEARLRARQSVLLVVGEWPNPAVTIRSRTVGWAGLGQGTGCLVEQHLELSVTERHRNRSARLTLPERP